MEDLSNIDIDSLTEEERRELRAKIESRLGLQKEVAEDIASQSINRLDLVEEARKIQERSALIRQARAEEQRKLTDKILEPYTVTEESEEDTSEIELDETMEGYLDTLRKIKEKTVSEDADLMNGNPSSTPATMADIASLRTSLASLGGGGIGETEVESLINTTVVNNFGLTPLDSNASSFDSDDVILIVDSDYVEQRLPQDVKVRFRLDATTPVILNSSGVTSITTTSTGQNLKFDVNFETPFASADDYITMLTLDQEGVDRTSTLIPLVNAESRTPVVIQQNTGSVRVAVEKVDTADNQDEGVLNVKVFKF